MLMCTVPVQGDTNSSSALDVVFFVREIMETNPKLRPTILTRLLDTFSQIRSSRVCSCALWILSEYCTNPQDINAALEVTFSADLSGGGTVMICTAQRSTPRACAAAPCESRQSTAQLPRTSMLPWRWTLLRAIAWNCAAFAMRLLKSPPDIKTSNKHDENFIEEACHL